MIINVLRKTHRVYVYVYVWYCAATPWYVLISCHACTRALFLGRGHNGRD